LLTLQGFLETGQVTPVVDRCFELDRVPEALSYLQEGHARGKIVINVASR
jgi:NADPH:quinone reductase-like Zn-dependent oxidoreductase